MNFLNNIKRRNLRKGTMFSRFARSKKAEESVGDVQPLVKAMNLLIDLALAAGILAFMVIYVYTIISFDNVEQKYIARDLSLTRNALYTVPWNVVVNYENKDVDISKFIISQNAGITEISSLDEKSKAKYPYINDNLYLYTGIKLLQPERLEFAKIGNNVMVDDGSMRKNLLLLKCPNVDTDKVDWKEGFKVLVILPEKSEGMVDSEGLLSNVAKELVSVADYEVIVLDDSFLEDIDSEGTRTDKIIEIINEKKPNITITLGVLDQAENKNSVVAKMLPNILNKEKNEKLGCNIVNMLTSKFIGNYTGANVMMVEDSEILVRFVKERLDMSGMYLEVYIANKNNEYGEGILKDKKAVAEAINRGIHTYYDG